MARSRNKLQRYTPTSARITVSRYVPSATPSYINLAKAFSYASKSKWARMPFSPVQRSGPLVRKSITVQLPRPGQVGRAVIGRRGISIAPKSALRGLAVSQPPAAHHREQFLQRTPAAPRRGQVAEAHRKRRSEVKLFGGK